jgi:hypothetical protein
MADTIQAARLFSLSEVLGHESLVAVAIGPEGEPLLLTLQGTPDYRDERKGASFPRSRARRPNRFRLHHCPGGKWQAVDLDETDENFHHLQPLGSGEWLLVRARSGGDSDPNAHVYDAHGHRLRSFPAGDGINDVQTTLDGRIWVSYFDEGVFGDTTLGSSGLVCLDDRGQCRFRFSDLVSPDVPYIADCYALNVASDADVWAYYYTDFPLVHLRELRIHRVWPDVSVGGAAAFAVLNGNALFAGSYGDRAHLSLVRLGEATARELTVVDTEGQPVEFVGALGRAERLFLTADETVFTVDVASAFAA